MVPVDWVVLEKDRRGNSPQTEGRSGDVLNLGRLNHLVGHGNSVPCITAKRFTSEIFAMTNGLV